MQYIKQFDSIRALSISLVLISHWWPKDHLLNITPNGALGVDTFFVLSGFLITSILFQRKEELDEKGLLFNLKNFLVRRTLRIFPIYYILLTLLFILDARDGLLSTEYVYHFTYTSNFSIFKNEQLDGSFSHLWSLSVEEQFYLV